jgi:glucuronoarabinoxylan endo-1,4-beta-xylanase
MREVILTLTTTVVFTVALFSSHVVGATVTVDVKTSHQKIAGFGTCSAWCGTLTASEGELLFSTTKGAGLSLHRIQIQKTGVDQSETANTKLANGYGVKVWGTPWYCKNGVKVSGKDYDTLSESNYQAWADVLASAANTLKNAGAPLYAISSQNEPDIGWTKYDAPTLAKWVGKYLGPTMASKAPDTKVMGIEPCNWCGFSNYYKVFKADADAWKYSAILATHEYGCSPTAYPDINAAGKEFWQTEIYDTQTDVEDPGMGSALRVSKLIHEALTIANMNAWHFWWIKPCAGCNNGALWVEATKKPAKRLWIMGNWSRYARPGFVRVSATEKPATGVTVTAFRDSALTKVVIVAINTNTSATSQDFSITGTSPKTMTPCITDPTRDLVEQSAQTLSSSTFTYSLPAQSVTSLVVDLGGTSVFPVSNAHAGQSFALKTHCGKASLTIEFTAPISGLTSVKLFNLNGTIVKTMTFRTITGGTYSRRFDLADLPEGFYMVKIDNDGRIINKSKILYLVQSAALSG